MDASGFRPATLAWLESHAAPERKALGQYFTPRAVRQRLLDALDLRPGMRVLDPGAGTGEFLLDVLEREPRADVHGWEVSEDLVRLCRDDHGLSGVEVRDALARPPRAEFDLVIGNPPYYEVRGRPELRERFAAVISGRANAFAMFFEAGLAALKSGGRLAFVAPPSMNNGAYFAALRRRILDVAAIESLVLLDDPLLFQGAQQSVMLVVLAKGARSDAHVFRADLGRPAPVPLFLEDPSRLAACLEGSHTLASLGMEIRTGRCVWNQRKGDLRRHPEPGAVHLVWAHNVTDAPHVEWDLDHPRRPQFVREPRPDRGPALVVNRITGTVGGGAIRAALVPDGLPFVGENHVNVVRRAAGGCNGVPYETVARGLRGDLATEAVRCLTGNTQISATELAHLVPVCPRSPRHPIDTPYPIRAR